MSAADRLEALQRRRDERQAALNGARARVDFPKRGLADVWRTRAAGIEGEVAAIEDQIDKLNKPDGDR